MMKKYLNFAFAGAIALTGAVGFASCSTSGEEVVSNINKPDYTPSNNTEQEFVKTQFAISIPTSGNQAGTRMDINGAPSNGVFKGIKGIHLYPISTALDANKCVTSSSTITTPIELSNISAFDQTGSGNSFNGKVYADVNIPVGTKAFLFYGEITNEAGGDLTPSYGTSGTPGNINFSLVPIQSATFSTLNDTQGNAVLAALNGIIGVLAAQETAAETASHASAIYLNALLQSFQSLKAGSANSVRAFVQNVYNKLTNIGTTYSATTYTNEVQDKIDDYFTVGGTSPNNTLTWTAANTFPNNIALPDGAIGLSYTSTPTPTFSFDSASGSQPELNTYVKPASLFYTVNSPIQTSTAAQVANYDVKTNWTQVVALYDSDTEVKSDTRGVVLVKPIQYGVGRLKSKVVLNSATLNANDADGGNLVVHVPDGGYPVTGILIGNQKNVAWNFEPTGATTYTIYDPVQTGGDVKAWTTASDLIPPNYTLALQTVKDEASQVVVELVNDGDDFYGKDNQLIPTGGKFYLAAQLDPTQGATYDEDDVTKNRVFCQDVETIVNFTVGANSLKKAYNTIPDLRSPQMELGLSVDLGWSPGLTFENVTF